MASTSFNYKVFALFFLFLIVISAVSVRSDDESESVKSTDSPVTKEGEAVAVDTLSAAEYETIESKSEKYQFQAEVNRLMDILINSLYSHREIFLRELISNAADAIDKVRYLSLTGATSLESKDQLEIRIFFDKDAKTLTIQDSGVGMTKEHLIKHLGIIASSGTTEFLEATMKGGSDTLSLIGQFGVGFYSVYLAADKVTVVSKHNDDKQYIWESTANGQFSVVEDPRGNTLGRGSAITLHLKDDAQEFLNEAELEKIAKRYSEFINWPIYLRTQKSVEEEIPDEDATEEAAPEKTEEDTLEVTEEDGAEKKVKTKKVTKTVTEWKRVNDVKAIWTRNPKDVSEEDYENFYESLAKDDKGYLTKIHFTAEGEITFKSILYIPKKAPPNLYDRFYEKSTALKLYVRRVLISDEFEDFLPRYLNFVRGVVDSDDLPLNVNRETLAQNKVLQVMSKKITRKVLEMLKKLADDSKKLQEEQKKKAAEEKSGDEESADEPVVDEYATFYENFGKSIKLGIIDDKANKPKLSKLLRYITSKSDGKQVSLEDYVDRMKPKQKNIYYITGENLASVKSSPFLERLTKKGYEVVFMIDPLDEYLMQSMSEFDGHNFQSVTKEGLKFGDDDNDKERLDKLKEEFSDLSTWLKGVYADRVEKVVVSNRIAQSPCVLVTGQYGWSANMERIMKAQTFANADEAKWMFSKKTMEINPYHPIIKALKDKVSAEATDKSLENLANLLYDSAILVSGFQPQDPKDFANRIHHVVGQELNVDVDAPIEEPAEEPAAEEPASSESSGASEAPSHDEL
jgi:heat shock protein beta